MLCFATLAVGSMKKKKAHYLKDQYSQDSFENDAYLLKLRELAKDHPEIKPEYESFRIYQAGFTNGVLNQCREFYHLIAQGIQNDKDNKRDPEGNLEIEREWFEGADGISFDNQTKFKGMTQDQFIDWIDSMVLNGDLPKGKWIENTVNGLTYHFDKSLLVEQTEKEFKKKSS